MLLTTTVCHPALANDNLSGIVVLAALAHALTGRSLRHNYRLLWSPGTLGPLCWLHHNFGVVDDILHGLAISCVGDRGDITYKRSRRGETRTDRAAEVVLRDRPGAAIVDWSPYGGDERQFCSPGFDLPFGAFSRSPADAFPEYHSSDDNLSVVTPEALADSYRTLLSIIDVFERDRTYVNASPFGEPQLGRRGLYRSIGRLEPRGGIPLAPEPRRRQHEPRRHRAPLRPAVQRRSRMPPAPLPSTASSRSDRRRPVVRPRPVTGADDALRVVRPRDAEEGVIPPDSRCRMGGIRSADRVEDVAIGEEGLEAMCAALRNVKTPPGLGVERSTEPRPCVDDSTRRSTATSKMAPRVQRTSFAS